MSSSSYSTDFSTSTSSVDAEKYEGIVSMDNRTPVIEASEIEYNEGDVLGSGAFGTVFKGKCRGENVAIKILTASLKESEIKEFKNECEILMSIHHRNVITFMGACVDSDNLAMVTELLDGDLEHFLRDNFNSNFTFLKKMKMMRDIAKGMAWLHGANPPIVHRDLKPSNILLDTNLEAKITDFGLSVVSEKKGKIKKTAGSALWMAPECHRHETYDEKVDVYSFGICAWQIMTGETLPFRHYVEQDAFREFVDAVSLDDERPSLEKVPSIMHDFLNSLWDPKSSERIDFQTAIHVADDIILQAIIYDEESREFWKNSFGDKLEVKYKQFFSALYNRLGCAKPEKGVRTCIKLILCADSDGSKVTLQRFGKILQWFGPLLIPGRLDDHLVDRMESMIRSDWFWGDIDAKAAERALNAKSFLVRLSTNNQIRKQPFSLSIKLKKITHYRIEFVNGHYHCKQLPVKKNQKIDLESRTIFGLIEKLQKTKAYRDVVPLSGSDFSRLLGEDIPEPVYGTTDTTIQGIDDIFLM